MVGVRNDAIDSRRAFFFSAKNRDRIEDPNAGELCCDFLYDIVDGI